MDCSACNERLIDYHFAELAPAERREVAGHLGDCGRCATEYCRLHADLAGFRDFAEAAPRREVAERLRARVAREFPPPWWRRLSPRGAFGLAYPALLAVTVLLLVWALLRSPPMPAAEGASHNGRRTGVSAPHRTLLPGYDASRILAIDPDLL